MRSRILLTLQGQAVQMQAFLMVNTSHNPPSDYHRPKFHPIFTKPFKQWRHNEMKISNHNAWKPTWSSGKCMFLLTTDTITLLLYTCPNCKTKATIEEGFFPISSEFQDNTVVIKQKKGSTCKNIQSGGGFISVFFF